MKPKQYRIKSNWEFNLNLIKKLENNPSFSSIPNEDVKEIYNMLNLNRNELDIFHLNNCFRIDELGMILPIILSADDRIEYFSEIKKIACILRNQKYVNKMKLKIPKINDLFMLQGI